MREREEPEVCDGGEPDEDDYTTTDHRRFYQYGRLVLTVADGDDHVAAMRARMDRQQFWPGAWFVSDHGNCHPMSL